MLQWLIEGGIGPALVALPVNWTGQVGAEIAQFWFRRLRRTDDLSRLVSAAVGGTVELSREQFKAVRQLLEDERTWSIAGQGTVEDLITLIASALQQHAGEQAEDTRAAAACIARGLLEFGVSDVEPGLFQRLLFARLRRIEAREATILDHAMISMHADVAAWFTQAQELDSRRSAEVMGQLRQILDRLPPAPADRGEVAIYLATLIGWLSTDPWPRDQRFARSSLDASTLELSLRVTAREEELDADELAERCHRLVVLGGPGSGKTWLARRTARRCAQNALGALVAGDDLEEIELPLYTTCSHLFKASGDIRHAVVSSALDQLADLGGSRLSMALRIFFTERNARTLLVIDSLDEASGPDDRLLQADTMPWRIFLSSRPDSWNQQLEIDSESGSEQIAELQPLRYPGEVEFFIRRWFAADPDRGAELVTQIAQRPAIQQAARVPLILAFYCLVGGDQPLPRFRRELYQKVLKRMLTGRWRGRGPQPEVEFCMKTLRMWAWAGDRSDPTSGIGVWDDEIPTGQQAMSPSIQEAVSHVATPVGLPDLDTGLVPRRFVHRSLREHLVAEYVAGLPVSQAVRVLFPHLWHDADWEQSVPAAITLHPQRDELLRELLRRAARSRDIPADLSVIDGGWQVRQLLGRIGSESYASDWSPEMAGIIGRARVELARSRRTGDLAAPSDWEASNRQVRQMLLEFMRSDDSKWQMRSLVVTLIQLYPTPSDSRLAADLLLRRLIERSDSLSSSYDLIQPLAQLDLTAEGKRQVRLTLLALMGDDTSRWASFRIALLKLDPTAEDKARIRSGLLRGLLGRTTGSWDSEHTSEWGVIFALREVMDDPGQVRQELLSLMHHEISAQGAASLAYVLTQLDPTEEELRRARTILLGLLERQDTGRAAYSLTAEIPSLGPTPAELHRARTALLGLLERLDKYEVSEAARGLVALQPSAEDLNRARAALLALLNRETFDGVDPGVVTVELEPDIVMARELAQLEPAPEQLCRARELIIERLVHHVARISPTREIIADSEACVLGLALTSSEKRHGLGIMLSELARLAGEDVGGAVAMDLAPILKQLTCTAEDRENARSVMLEILIGAPRPDYSSTYLINAIVQLAQDSHEKYELRHALLQLMRSEMDPEAVMAMAVAICQLDPAAGDSANARAAVLAIMTGPADDSVVCRLAHDLCLIAPTPDDCRHAREILLTRMTAETTNNSALCKLASSLRQLDPLVEDKRQAREILLARMTAETTNNSALCELASSLRQFDLPAEDKRQAREILLARMAIEVDTSTGCKLAQILAQLELTPEERRQACGILANFAASSSGYGRPSIVRAVIELSPTAEDVSKWKHWEEYSSLDLLAAVRHNSSLMSWQASLSSYVAAPVPFGT